MEIKTLTRKNKKHYIDQILTTISDQGIQKSPIWLSIRHEDVTNRQAFMKYNAETQGITIVPKNDWKPAKELVVQIGRANLTDLRYREEPAQIAYSSQLSLQECLWQINRLFHTCFHPEEPNVKVEIISVDKVRLSITDDNHLLFNRGSITLPAVDVSITLNEMFNGSDVTLNREDCLFALNLYGRKTDLRKQEQITWNAYDALMMAIALRDYQKNGTRDGLNEYALNDLPPHHAMLIANGMTYGDTNRNPFVPTVSETESTNALTSLSYVPELESYPTNTKNVGLVHYIRFDIQDYLKEFFKSPTEFEKLSIRIEGVHDRSKDDVLIDAFKGYLNMNTDKNIVDKNGHRYNQDILVRRKDGDVIFDFVNHPLLSGEIRVDFGDA